MEPVITFSMPMLCIEISEYDFVLLYLGLSKALHGVNLETFTCSNHILYLT